MRVPDAGRVINVAGLIATGVNGYRHWEILGRGPVLERLEPHWV